MRGKVTLALITLPLMLSGCGQIPPAKKSGDGLSQEITATSSVATSTSSPSSEYKFDPGLWSQQIPVPAPKEHFTAQDFTGNWNRTNVPEALYGSIKISNQKPYSFNLDFFGGWAEHTGEFSGTATIISPHQALLRVYGSDDIFSVSFTLENHQLIVEVKPYDSSLALGLGMNVGISGTYTLRQPTYTNAGIVDKVFKTADMKKRAQALLGNKAYGYVTETMRIGFEDDPATIHYPLDYSGFENGAGFGAKVKIDSDKIYVLLIDNINGDVFYTNDVNYRQKIPAFFEYDSKVRAMQIVYKPV